ncbi:MAG: rhodanese-like domain-containing protein [Candidatus Thorarchaeota archaeon]
MKTSSQYQMAKGAILAALLLVVCGIVQPAAAQELVPQSGSFQSISVEAAQYMLENGNSPNPIVLDVRYQCEYNLGHLFGAVLIPHDQLEANMSELDAYKDHEIIVYCKSGVRSLMACDILASHDFTKVYNMEGGILAWIDAGFPIYTTYHHATVNIVDEEILLQIEPLLLYQPDSAPCTQDQTCSNQPTDGQPTNVQSTVVEQDESHTVVRVTYEVNDIMYEITVTNTILWSYSELTDEINRTAGFTLTEVSSEDTSTQVYGFSYVIKHAEYTLTLYTNLVPLNAEFYNSSFTTLSYLPAGNSEVTSLESVEFKSSVTLSQQYAILGKVAKVIGKVYEKSGDETLAQLANGYYTIKEEAKQASKLVEKQLAEYNLQILQSGARIMDADTCNPSQMPDCGWYCNACCLCTVWDWLCVIPHMVGFMSRVFACFLCVLGLLPACISCLMAIISMFSFNPEHIASCCLGTWYWDCCCPPG